MPGLSCSSRATVVSSCCAIPDRVEFHGALRDVYRPTVTVLGACGVLIGPGWNVGGAGVGTGTIGPGDGVGAGGTRCSAVNVSISCFWNWDRMSWNCPDWLPSHD